MAANKKEKKLSMNYDKIDTKKSIRKGALVFKKGILDVVSEWFVYLTLLLSFPILTGSILFNELFKSPPNQSTSFAIQFTLSLCLCIFLFISIIKANRLFVFPGKSIEANRSIIIEIAQNLNWNILKNTKAITILSPKLGLLSTNWGRQIVIIYNDHDILVNCMAFGLYGIISPFHFFGNRSHKNIIKNQFQTKINTYVDATAITQIKNENTIIKD